MDDETRRIVETVQLGTGADFLDICSDQHQIGLHSARRRQTAFIGGQGWQTRRITNSDAKR